MWHWLHVVPFPEGSPHRRLELKVHHEKNIKKHYVIYYLLVDSGVMQRASSIL
jgi:hypothetical protein